MAKKCPNLINFSDEERREFWQKNDPETFRNLQDIFLGESLPIHDLGEWEDYDFDNLPLLREKAGYSLKEMASKLHLTTETLLSWEQGLLKTSPSLVLVYEKLAEQSQQ